MKRSLLILCALLLVSGVVLGQPTWTPITTFNLSAFQCRSVEYLPTGVIWIPGGDVPYTGQNFMWISTDHGSTWTKRAVFTNAALTSLGISNVTARDANLAVVGLTTGEILRTTNGGVKWDTVMNTYDMSLGFIDGVKFVTGDTVIAVGDADASGTFVGRSTDAGATWTRITNLPDSSKRSEWFALSVTYGQAIDVYDRTIWAAEYYGSNKNPFILKSTDAGTTWTDFPIALPGGIANDYYLRSINFKDANTGFGVIRQVTTSSSTGYYLVKTTDGGLTWSDTIGVAPGISHDSARVMAAKWVRGTSTVIALGYAGSFAKAWMSTDDGTTWTNMSAPGGTSGSDFRNASFISATKGVAVGYTNAAIYTGVTDVEPGEGTPVSYTLSQNYPNPFNPTTTIQFTLAHAGQVTLDVYDVLGRQVARLVDQQLPAGPHQAVFNASGLSSGVYLYTLHAGEFTATKSLLLVK